MARDPRKITTLDLLRGVADQPGETADAAAIAAMAFGCVAALLGDPQISADLLGMPPLAPWIPYPTLLFWTGILIGLPILLLRPLKRDSRAPTTSRRRAP